MSKKIKEDNEQFINDEEKESFFLRKLFFALILIIILVIIYSRYIATSGLIIKEYTIKNNNLPKSFNGLKIAHFSDFHYGSTTNLDNLKIMVKQINLSKPDIIIFTGDFFDKNINVSDKDINNIKNELSKLKSTYGKYYITGNHDLKFNNYENLFNESNFINLNDNFDLIYNKNNDYILLTGTSYNSDFKFLDNILNEQTSSFKINIMHKPDDYDNIKKYNYNLVLAGHSHNGQITLPIYGAVYTPNGAKKYYKPYYKLDNTDMYISSGIGTSKFKFRLFNRPSFNLYRIKNND